MYGTPYINKTVDVIIDRPLGSKHPTHGFIYPLNYGYLPNTVSGDGEPIDCYILGIFEPIKAFKGKCIAVIKRKSEDDDKLIVVPSNRTFTNAEIKVLTEFQERFFELEILR